MSMPHHTRVPACPGGVEYRTDPYRIVWSSLTRRSSPRARAYGSAGSGCSGELPASGGERKMLLLASSIAGGTPVSLNDALPGIDRRNAPAGTGPAAHLSVIMVSDRSHPDSHPSADLRNLSP